MSRKKKTAAKGTPVGREIIEGLTELVESVEAGDRLEERFTVRTVNLDLRPREYTPDNVKRTRAKLNASQAIFARFLGVNVGTVQSWEQGARIPSPIASRFMDEINRDSKRWQERLLEAITTKS